MSAPLSNLDLAFAVGDRVRATYPNSQWGEGVVEDANVDARFFNEETRRWAQRKPYVVRRDDGQLGYFHPDQIEEAS